jgi:hypothetical protein
MRSSGFRVFALRGGTRARKAAEDQVAQDPANLGAVVIAVPDAAPDFGDPRGEPGPRLN